MISPGKYHWIQSVVSNSPTIVYMDIQNRTMLCLLSIACYKGKLYSNLIIKHKATKRHRITKLDMFLTDKNKSSADMYVGHTAVTGWSVHRHSHADVRVAKYFS